MDYHAGGGGAGVAAAALAAQSVDAFGNELTPVEADAMAACGTCHKGRIQSISYCTECHESAPVSEGWLTMAEAQELGVIPEVSVE